ncbi:957_t:CDS:2, partial [Racocetra fulgida]
IIFMKMDFQLTDYRVDGVAEFFERPKQILLFLLEVSEDPSNPDLDKFRTDRYKLMSRPRTVTFSEFLPKEPSSKVNSNIQRNVTKGKGKGRGK